MSCFHRLLLFVDLLLCGAINVLPSVIIAYNFSPCLRSAPSKEQQVWIGYHISGVMACPVLGNNKAECENSAVIYLLVCCL